MIGLFSGLSARQFAKLVRQLRAERADPARKERPWSLAFEDRLLLVAGPGRPPGRRNTRRAPIRDRGKKAKRDKTLAQRKQRLTSTQA